MPIKKSSKKQLFSLIGAVLAIGVLVGVVYVLQKGDIFETRSKAGTNEAIIRTWDFNQDIGGWRSWVLTTSPSISSSANTQATLLNGVLKWVLDKPQVTLAFFFDNRNFLPGQSATGTLYLDIRLFPQYSSSPTPITLEGEITRHKKNYPSTNLVVYTSDTVTIPASSEFQTIRLTFRNVSLSSSPKNDKNIRLKFKYHQGATTGMDIDSISILKAL